MIIAYHLKNPVHTHRFCVAATQKWMLYKRYLFLRSAAVCLFHLISSASRRAAVAKR